MQEVTVKDQSKCLSLCTFSTILAEYIEERKWNKWNEFTFMIDRLEQENVPWNEDAVGIHQS